MNCYWHWNWQALAECCECRLRVITGNQVRSLECPLLGAKQTQSTQKRTPEFFGSAKVGGGFGLG